MCPTAHHRVPVTLPVPGLILSPPLVCKFYEDRNEDNLLPNSSKAFVKLGREGRREGRVYANTVLLKPEWAPGLREGLWQQGQQPTPRSPPTGRPGPESAL